MTFDSLAEVVVNLDKLDDEDLIFVQRIGGKWLPTSKVIIQPPKEDGQTYPSKVDQAEFFLDVNLAREIIEDWMVATRRSFISLPEQIQLLIYYVENDASPPLSWDYQ